MEYMPLPAAYDVLNASELGALRATVTEADTAAARETDPIQRMRAEQHAKALRHQLEAAELAARLDTERRARAVQHLCSAPAAVNAASQVQFMEPVPYFAEHPQQAAPGASQAVQWPQDFVERTALLDAAVAEVRRLRLV